MHTVRGQYSEIFFSTETGSGIGRLTVDNFSKLLYSTFPKDVEDIGRYTNQGVGTADAIHKVMADRGLAA